MRARDAVATYYVALGLAGQVGSTGEMFNECDLQVLAAQGHELGCHTYDHHPAWATPSRDYEASVVKNAQALGMLLPTARFKTHSFPISYPRPRTKRLLSGRFAACRGGGQEINIDTIDLNYLKSFFLEQSRNDWAAIERIIASNDKRGGWLIFSTHDVAHRPTAYGCTPEFFERVVDLAVKSNATILPVWAALERNLSAIKDKR